MTQEDRDGWEADQLELERLQQDVTMLNVMVRSLYDDREADIARRAMQERRRHRTCDELEDLIKDLEDRARWVQRFLEDRNLVEQCERFIRRIQAAKHRITEGV